MSICTFEFPDDSVCLDASELCVYVYVCSSLRISWRLCVSVSRTVDKWKFLTHALGPRSLRRMETPSLELRGWTWARARATLSGHLRQGSGSRREKPGGQGSGAQSRAAQSRAQGRWTDRAHSALCWQRCVPAPAVGRLPVGKRVPVPGPDPLLESALRNPLPSQAHPRFHIPSTAFPPPPVPLPTFPCRASSPYSFRLANGGLCDPVSEASLTL